MVGEVGSSIPNEAVEVVADVAMGIGFFYIGVCGHSPSLLAQFVICEQLATIVEYLCP
jgi:hypothetical protein